MSVEKSKVKGEIYTMRKYNYDMCIVMVSNGTIPRVYDYLYEDETKEDAEMRGLINSFNNIRTYMNHHDNFPQYKEDGTEYWQTMVEKEDKTDYKVMSYEEFVKLERESILNLPIEEITEQKFNEMLDCLPPIGWVTRNDVEMFCMREFWTGSYTNQYAKDNRTGKYYTKLVDFKDQNTWINNLLRK